MRDFLRKRDTPWQLVDVNVVIEEVLRILRTEAVIWDIRLSKELTPNLPPVTGDRIQLQQVLLNVIANAQQAMVRVPSSARALTIRTSRGGGSQIVLTVDDSGPGFQADTLPQAFEPFFTTRPEGIGMGLAICRSIIEAHGGGIIAENRPEGGARIQIELSAAEDSVSSLQSSGAKI
jgi:C4-dicarboxylate-specific signal transduction histidine kinase